MAKTTLRISTENGTGSATANRILFYSLVREGFKVSAKNLFPSNIAGLPTNYILTLASTTEENILAAFNKKTFSGDLKNFLSGSSVLIFNSGFKVDFNIKNTSLGLDCRALTKDLHQSITVKKLLYNMLYVGALAKALDCNLSSFIESSYRFFKKFPEDILQANIKALEAGFEVSQVYFSSQSFLKEKSDSYIYNGNTCSALGFLDGGATVATWYPITPSSSLTESFERLSKNLKPNQRSVLQCEDEITSAVAALGAGWSGARAFTATSGPGLSLMQETIGLGYFTESPFVIADVQRAGPSTGLPTRTAQGDLTLAHFSSHGDTLHPVLLPGTPQEAYDDAFISLNLADSLQTPVFYLSDLDLGMNDWAQKAPLKQTQLQIDRGDLAIEAQENFKRYSNEQNVAKRSLPRISDPSLAYFTRGSGHDEFGDYTEDSTVYQNKLIRLKQKIKNAKISHPHFFPQDFINEKNNALFSIVVWGSTVQILEDLTQSLPEFSFYRVRSLPLSESLYDFLNKYKYNFIVEQNRDGQLNQIIKSQSQKSVCTYAINQFNGLPIDADSIAKSIKGVLDEL